MDPSGTLDVHSIFYTIQGEGPFAGTPCVFVRLGGCNLQCPGCDTVYTDQPGTQYKRKLYTAHELRQAVEDLFVENSLRTDKKLLVVITGGEPFRQNVSPFIRLLIEHNYYVQVESNGTLPAPADAGWNKHIHERDGAYLVCSPKTSKISVSHANFACAFKYVMSHESIHPTDGLPIQALALEGGGSVARPPPWYKGPIYLQPMDHTFSARIGTKDWQNKKSIQACVDSCLKYGYTLQLQIHKYLGVE